MFILQYAHNQLLYFKIPHSYNIMDIQKPKQTTYEYPSTPYLTTVIKQRFETLNRAINFIHKAPASEGRVGDRFRLKSFDGKNIHLFQCSKEECNSHILIKSQLDNKSDSKNRIDFEIFSVSNTHNHKNPTILALNRQKPKQFPVIQKGSDSEDVQIDKLDYIRNRLRRYNISNYFRDYVNCFSPNKQSNASNNLPFILPEIFKSKPFLVTLKIGFKCLNERKKTYFFIIEVFSFGQLYTEVKFVTCLKSKNPEIFLYTLTLINTLLNSIRNCAILMEEELFKFITRIKGNASQLMTEKKEESQKFIKFFMTMESDFFTDCTQKIKSEKRSNQGHVQKHHVQKSERQYDRRKYFQQESEHSQDSFMSTDEQKNKFGLSPFMKKNYIKLQQMQLREVRSVKNKCLIAETTYKQATMGKNGEWHICEEKPSVIQRINDLFQVQENRRLKKEMNKQKAVCRGDSNFIALSSGQSDDERVEQKMKTNKQYLQVQQKRYMNHVLSQMFGEMQFKEPEEKKMANKQADNLVLISEDEQKMEKESEVNSLIKPKQQDFEQMRLRIESKSVPVMLRLNPLRLQINETKSQQKGSRLEFRKEQRSEPSEQSSSEQSSSEQSSSGQPGESGDSSSESQNSQSNT